MNFNLISHSAENDVEEYIRFLNIPAREFYGDEHTFQDPLFSNSIKGILLSGFVELERTLKGTFGCDLHLDSVHFKTIKKMFPNALDKMFVLNEKSDRKYVGYVLDRFRNINAHAILSERDYELFKNDFSFLKNEQVFNPKITYFDSEITMAGVFFLLFNFLRAESIYKLTKKEHMLGLISCGESCIDTAEKFVNEISHVDLEVDIRQYGNNDLETSIFGEYINRIKKENNCFSYFVGSELHPTFKVDGSIVDNIVKINKGSLTKSYYEEDYQLTLEDLKGFMNYSNQLPPFTFIDYLHECGITVFDSDVKSQIRKNWDLISKLNKPKFYGDKNIKILLLPEDVSDYRLISNMISDCLHMVFLNIEKLMYEYTKMDTKGEFSNILNVFKTIDTSKSKATSFKINILRNMVVHGSILGDSVILNYGVETFSIDFVAKTLNKMLKLLKENAKDDENDSARILYNQIQASIKTKLLDVLVKAKYKQANNEAWPFFKYYPVFPGYKLKNIYYKNLFVNRSILDITKFDCIVEDVDYEQQRPLFIDVEGFDGPFYLLNSADREELIEDFCNRNGYQIESKKRDSIIISYNLVKNDI